MMSVRARIAINFFSIFSLFVFSFVYLYAKDGADYREINKLIKKKKQDEAITQIVEMLDKHPESLNMATDSLKKAMKNQDNFVAEFLKIIDQLYKDPDNTAKILKIIAALEQMNTSMEPQMVAFLHRLKNSSIYARNKIKFNNLMKSGIELINAEKYSEAVSTLLQGYSICYDEYEYAYQGSERLEATDLVINAIREANHSLRKEDVKFLLAINAYRVMLKQNILNIDETIVKNFETEAELMHSIGKSVFENGERLNAFLAEDEQKEDFQIDSFLPYSTRLTLGRLNATEYEGVQGALDAALMKRFLDLEKYILNLVQDSVNASFARFKFGSSFGSATQILKNYITEYERVVRLVEKLNKDSVKFPLNQTAEEVNIASMKQLKDLLEKFVAVYDNFIEIQGHAFRNYEDYGNESSIADIKNLNTAYNAVFPLKDQLQEYSFETLSTSKDELLKIQDRLIANISDLYQERLDKYTDIKNTLGKDFCEKYEEEFDSIKNLIDGVQKEGGKIGEIVRYPTEALKRFAEEEKSIQSDIKLLENAIAFVSSAKSKIERRLSTRRSLDGIVESDQKLKNILKDIAGYSAIAKDNIFKMKLAKQEAEFRYSEAVRNARASDFIGARSNIERSQAKSNEALSFENDEEYRKIVDERLTKLGAEINQKENEFVVREVRSSLEKAKNLYFNGNFGDAESILKQANIRWHSTNIDENEEIQNWLNITQTASIMKTGRSIPQSATLYPQMSQLLSNSKQLYNEATKTIKVDRKDALKKLNEAKNNIKQVLLVYPLNEEAGQLSLRIDQLIDPENFNSQVKKKIEKIRSSYKRNPQADYAELLNLYIMDRRFPGIAKLKDEVEIYLGIKIIPPDTSQIDKAAALTLEADAIFRRGDKSRYEDALQRLNQAIKLNPNNERAALLKDRVQMAMGGTAIAVLSYANEEKYRKAVLALQSGNKITAIALVEELLQDAEGRKSAKVHDLKKRINAQL